MNLVKFRGWSEFQRDYLRHHASLDHERREQLLFRGHADARWGLETTIDRGRAYPSDEDRTRYFDLLLEMFRREAMSVGALSDIRLRGVAFELLARHHGLPSVHLDWTTSPYIAAFFSIPRTSVEPGPASCDLGA